MTFEWPKIEQSKREFRQRLAARPIAEKLAMLDALGARAIALRGSRLEAQPNARTEEPPRCLTGQQQTDAKRDQ